MLIDSECEWVASVLSVTVYSDHFLSKFVLMLLLGLCKDFPQMHSGVLRFASCNRSAMLRATWYNSQKVFSAYLKNATI